MRVKRGDSEHDRDSRPSGAGPSAKSQGPTDGIDGSYPAPGRSPPTPLNPKLNPDPIQSFSAGVSNSLIGLLWLRTAANVNELGFNKEHLQRNTVLTSIACGAIAVSRNLGLESDLG